ncbi:MAG: amidohydrolase family protein [Tepidisphaeraceae bacterium]
MSSKRLFLARFVAPMDAPLLRDGGVVVEGSTIVTLGPADALAAAHRDAEVVNLGRAVLTPGLVNAHTHLELSGMRRGRYSGNFVEWILSIRPRLSPDRSDFQQRLADALRIGVEQSVSAGVTTVGDISAFHELTRPILRIGQLRVVSYGEALGLGRMREQFSARLTTATDVSMQTDRLHVGLSPHSPYTVDRRGLEECLWLAKNNELPLSIHLAESRDEADFLLHRSGPFRKLWETTGMWNDDVPLEHATPVRMAHALGLLDHPTLLAHVNYADDEEVGLLSAGRASVVFCPRTHSWFGHVNHRWHDMLKRGVNVCVGTDSLASSPNLNLLDDLRLLRTQRPDVDAGTLWTLITTRAARALQMESHIGSITPGKLADFASFPVISDDPLNELLTKIVLPDTVWINGDRVK